jgi:transcriptional regulator with XRE-family HTH domain
MPRWQLSVCMATRQVHDRLNRIASQCIWSVLRARGWTQGNLAKESGVERTEISRQLAGERPINAQHLVQYLHVLNHQERRQLLIAWLRDNMGPEMAQDFLNEVGDDLSNAVKVWTPPLDKEDNRMLAWWAHEMARDAELEELFKLLSAKAGYRPTRTAARRVKRRRRGGSAAVVLLLFVSILAPAPCAHARQVRAPAFALGRRECFLLPAAQAA